MKKIGTVHFAGKSGSRYKFDAYPLEADLDAGLCGVFVVTERKRSKSKPGFVHVRLGTGQSEDLRTSLADGGKGFSEKGANCFCVHAQEDKALRTSIEQDLMRKRPPAVKA